MRPVLFLAALFLLLFSGFRAVDPKSVSVNCQKATLKLNKAVLNNTWTIGTVTTALGKPDRAHDAAANRIHVYDQLGLLVFESLIDTVHRGHVIELNFFFELPAANADAPKQAFPGRLRIGRLNMTRQLAMYEVKEGMSDYNEQNCAIPHTLKYYSTQAHLFIWLYFSDTDLYLKQVSFTAPEIF